MQRDTALHHMPAGIDLVCDAASTTHQLSVREYWVQWLTVEVVQLHSVECF